MGEFTDIADILSGREEGKHSIRGWLQNKRSSGGVLFLILRDGTGMIQCVLRKDSVDPETFEMVEKLPLESVLEVHGAVKRDPRSPWGYELDVDGVRVLHEAARDWPIAKKYHGPASS